MSNFFSSKELTVGVGLDATTVGTKFAGTFTQIESEGVSFPTFDDMVVERRGGAGSGIMTASTDIFKYNLGSAIEVSVSGYMTDELFPILTSNALGTAYSNNVLTIANAVVANTKFEHGATSALQNTLSFAFNGVGGTGFEDCVVVAGCVITSLELTADPNEDGGRMKFSLTATSRTPLVGDATYSATASTMSAYSTAYTFLGDFDNHIKVHNADAILKSFAMTIENPVVYAGTGGSGVDGAPQTYIRSVPEMSVMLNPVIKYDTAFDGLWDLSRSSTSLTSPAFSMSDHATYDHADATRTILATDATIEELAWDEGDYLGLSVSMKVRGDADPSLYFKYV
tara:strand:+ start:615 stop:1637 length:1023 start_codon:yes stop_codon:yes gene_type:complete